MDCNRCIDLMTTIEQALGMLRLGNPSEAEKMLYQQVERVYVESRTNTSNPGHRGIDTFFDKDAGPEILDAPEG